MIRIWPTLLGLCVGVGCISGVSGCGDDDSIKTPTQNVGTPPKGACKPGKQAECVDSDCKSGQPAVATCGSNEKYGTCKCPSKASKPADAGKDGGGDAASAGADAGSAGGGTGDSWPMMGYDERNNYFNPNEHTLAVGNAKNLVEKWRFTVAGYPPGTPVVGEGKVFVMATGGTYAIDEKTGKMIWAKSDIAGTASAAYADGFVYLHASVGANLYKVAAKDGKVVWGPVQTYDGPGCDGTSSPIIAGTKVLVGHSCGAIEVTGAADALAKLRGGVEAFDIESGDRVWTYFTVPDDKKGKEDGAMVWSTVGADVAGGTVFASTGNNYSLSGDHSDSIHAIGLEDGKKKWHTQVRPDDTWSLMVASSGPDTDFGANPIVAEVAGKKVVAAGDKGADAWEMDRETGEIVWSRSKLSASRDAAHGGMLMNGAFDGEYFYMVSNQPSAPSADAGVGYGDADTKALLHALDPKNKGEDVWAVPKAFTKFTWGAPSLANGLLVVPNDDDLYVLEAATGKELIKFNTGGTIAAGAAAIVDGRIIVASGLQYQFDSAAKANNQVICYGLK